MKLYKSWVIEKMTDGDKKDFLNLILIGINDDDTQIKIWTDGYAVVIEAVDGNTRYEAVDYDEDEMVGHWVQTEDGSTFEPK